MAPIPATQHKNELNDSVSLNYKHTSSIFHAADGIEKRALRMIGQVACAALATIAFLFETVVNIGRTIELGLIWVKNRFYKPIETAEKPAAQVETPPHTEAESTEYIDGEIETLPPIPIPIGAPKRKEMSHQEEEPSKIVEDGKKPLFVLTKETALKISKTLIAGALMLGAFAIYFNSYPFSIEPFPYNVVPVLIDGSLFTA